MVVERCPVANANPPVTVKQIAPAMSQRRNEAMTMTPFCQCGSAHADPPKRWLHPPRAAYLDSGLKSFLRQRANPSASSVCARGQ